MIRRASSNFCRVELGAAPPVRQLVGQAVERLPRLVLALVDHLGDRLAERLGGAVGLVGRLAGRVLGEPAAALRAGRRLDRCGQPGDRFLAAAQRFQAVGESDFLVLVELVLLAEPGESLIDLAVQRVLAPDQPPGQRLGIARQILDIAGELPQLVLGPFEMLAGLVGIAALDRLGGQPDLLDVEPRPAVLGERRVNLEGEPPGVVLEGALGVGEGLELGGVLRRVGGVRVSSR